MSIDSREANREPRTANSKQENDFEKKLERAAAICQRPSQYAGWEMGSTARRILFTNDERRTTNDGFPKRVALVWPVPYAVAMRDERLLGLYQSLASTKEMLPERVFAPGADLKERLESAWFGLESKMPLEQFDAFIICEQDALAENLEEIKTKLQDRERVYKLDTSDQTQIQDQLVNIFKLWGWQATHAYDAPELFAYASGGREIPRSTISNIPMRQVTFRVVLKRFGWARFVSHLEQIQVIKNVINTSPLATAWTQSKKSKMRLSFGPAVSVGWASEAEFFDIDLLGNIESDALMLELKKALPLGFDIAGAKRIPKHFPSLEESANWVEYSITSTTGVLPNWKPILDYFQTRSAELPRLSVRKEKPGKKVDVIEIDEILTGVRQQEEGSLWMATRFGPRKNLKPEKILEAIAGWTQQSLCQDLLICRKALALESQSGKLRYL